MAGNQNFYLDITPIFLNYLKYVSIISYDDERTFLMYKYI
jgi:hypothetical protein